MSYKYVIFLCLIPGIPCRPPKPSEAAEGKHNLIPPSCLSVLVAILYKRGHKGTKNFKKNFTHQTIAMILEKRHKIDPILTLFYVVTTIGSRLVICKRNNDPLPGFGTILPQ